MNKRQFKASEFINSIYKNGKKPVSLEYCNDHAVYNITCTLNWDKDDKNKLIDKINDFDKDMRALPKFTKKAAGEVFTRYFADTKKYYNKDHLKLRAYRLGKLYNVGCPKIVTDNELQLLITLLIVNNYAVKDTVNTKEVEILDNEA